MSQSDDRQFMRVISGLESEHQDRSLPQSVADEHRDLLAAMEHRINVLTERVGALEGRVDDRRQG